MYYVERRCFGGLVEGFLCRAVHSTLEVVQTGANVKIDEVIPRLPHTAFGPRAGGLIGSTTGVIATHSVPLSPFG